MTGIAIMLRPYVSGYGGVTVMSNIPKIFPILSPEFPNGFPNIFHITETLSLLNHLRRMTVNEVSNLKNLCCVVTGECGACF